MSSSSDSDEETPGKGVFAMKFMQRARDRQKAEYDELKQDYRREVEEEKAERDRLMKTDWEVEDVEEKKEEEVESGRSNAKPRTKYFFFNRRLVF